MEGANDGGRDCNVLFSRCLPFPVGGEDSMTLRPAIGCTVAFAVLSIASGSSRAQGGRATASAAPDPCALMTREDAAAALGGAAGAAQPSKAGRSMMPDTAAASRQYAGSAGSHVGLRLWHAARNAGPSWRVSEV